MIDFLQQLINGLSVGATYALIALGYTMVYGVLRLINFAHGEVYMVGAVIGFTIAEWTAKWSAATPHLFWVAMLVALCLWLLLAVGLRWILKESVRERWLVLTIAALIPLSVAIPLGVWLTRQVGLGNLFWLRLPLIFVIPMIACSMLGFCIEFFAYRPLRNQPRLVSLITAIGVSLLLQNVVLLKYVYGPTPKSFPPEVKSVLSEPIIAPAADAHGVIISRFTVLNVGLALVLMTVLTFIILRTKMGLALRAVSYRFDTATLMGVNTDRTISFTFMLGSALAAVAGVLDGIQYNVEPLMGVQSGLKAFVAAVVGGIGSVPGALVGALIIGVTEAMVKTYISSSYSDAIVFGLLILILLVRPTGIFGRKMTEKL